LAGIVLLFAGWAAGLLVSDAGLDVKDGFASCVKTGTDAPVAGLAAFTTAEAPALSGRFVSPVAAPEGFLGASFRPASTPGFGLVSDLTTKAEGLASPVAACRDAALGAAGLADSLPCEGRFPAVTFPGVLTITPAD